jgi:uncharacterized phage-like protein YoqJ
MSKLQPAGTHVQQTLNTANPQYMLFNPRLEDMQTIAVTGHRFYKLGGFGDHIRIPLEQFAIMKLSEYKGTCLKVLTGMALGWDQAIAKACIHIGISFVACIPFKSQEDKWNMTLQKDYNRILGRASDIIYTDGGYGPYAIWKMHKRNHYMVDNSDMVLALWDGNLSGGTASCVRYAFKKDKPVVNCWDDWRKFNGEQQEEISTCN